MYLQVGDQQFDQTNGEKWLYSDPSISDGQALQAGGFDRVWSEKIRSVAELAPGNGGLSL